MFGFLCNFFSRLLTPQGRTIQNEEMSYLHRHRLTIVLAGGVFLFFCLLSFFTGGESSMDSSDVSDGSAIPGVNKELISSHLGEAFQTNSFPEEIELELNGEKKLVSVDYALDGEAHERMLKMFSSYKPDYGAFVAMDARTGRILSLVSYTRERDDLGNLALRATFPAASIFKVVTAGAALDLGKANPETIVPFNGSFHTLYKRNVQETRENRWTRRMTLREAFARSVNVFFGKLGLFYVGPQELMAYAERFRFNHPIRADFPIQTGYARISTDDPWSVVTAASGFTRDNTMSPMQGALMAAAVANDGVMMEPYIVESLRDQVGQVFYKANPVQASVIVEPNAAAELRVLMRETVHSGTSRKSFRKVARKNLFEDVEIGGKTGSLMGDDPIGKCDWFVGYLRYKDARIAVAALTVNEEKWRVKSSYLASSFFGDYVRFLKGHQAFYKARSAPALAARKDVVGGLATVAATSAEANQSNRLNQAQK